MKLKKGDKIRIKKLTKKEFEGLPEKYSDHITYKEYLNIMQNYFNKTAVISKQSYHPDSYWLLFNHPYERDYSFWIEELEKICLLSDKIKVLKELIK
jgi:hypothetical protein